MPARRRARALVTGATGFIGQYLCAEMMRHGWQVRGAVRSSVPLPEGVETAVVGNIDRGTDWRNALRDMDVVIHLAARVHVMKESSADPLSEFIEINLHGTENLALQAAQAGVKRLVFVSSIGVNGMCTVGEQAYSESDPPYPHSTYALSKWQAEQALHRISRETGLEVVILRPPLVYGPAAKGNFARLLAAINKGIPLPLGGAHNARSLVYVGNLADALISCASHPAAAGQTYLVRDGADVSTSALVEKIARELGVRSRSFYCPPALLRIAAVLLRRSSQIDQLFGSLRVNDAKLRRELSWIPPFTLDQGLHETADWYRGSISGRRRGTIRP